MRKFFKTFWKIITAPFRGIFWVFKKIAGFFSYLRERFRLFWTDESEAESRPTMDVVGEIVDNPKEMLPELLNEISALRNHLFRGVLFLALTTTLSFLFARQLLEFIAGPIGGLVNVQAIEVTESIGVFMRVSLLAGFTIASPYIIFEILLYIAPALKISERRVALLSIPVVTTLFVCGMAFAYFFMLGPALDVLVGFMDIPTKVRPSSYFPFVTNLMFWIGISFEFPIILLVLSWLRIVPYKFLKDNARYALVLLALFAGIITPTVDPINMLLVWGPLVGLYFLGLGLAFLGERARARQEARAQRGD